MGEHIFDMPHRYDLVHLKAAIIEASQHLCLTQHAFASFGHVIIQTTCEHQTRHNAFMEEIEAVNQPVKSPRIAFEDLRLDIFLRPVTTYIASIVRQLLIDDTETTVDTLGVIEQRQVHDGVVLIIRDLQEGKTVTVAHHFGLAAVQARFLTKHVIVRFGRDGQHRLMNRIDTALLTFLVRTYNFRAFTLLYLHRRYGHICRVLPVMLHQYNEGLQCADDHDRPCRYFRRQVIRQLRQDPPAETDQYTGIRDERNHRLPEPCLFIRTIELNGKTDDDPCNRQGCEQCPVVRHLALVVHPAP